MIQQRGFSKFTKKQILTAALLLLDEHVKHIDCELITKEGNIDCDTYYKVGRWHNCTNCMLNQYLDRVVAGEQSKYDIMQTKVKEASK